MIVYMPMVPEALVAMLACARIGAVHSVVFGGFAANELATRIDDAQPKVVVSASCGIEPGRIVAYKPLLDAAIARSQWKPDRCIVLQRPMLEAELDPARDLDWHEALAGAEPADCVPVAATDPLYIIYTSGTTGQPKGIVRDNGGHAVALAWSMKNIYDIDPGEVYWAASDIGWTVGHSYTVYGPLLHGCTTRPLRGQAGRHARRGRVLARVRRARRLHALHRADGVPRDPPAGSGRRAHRPLRPLAAPRALPRGRALRPGDAPLGRGASSGIPVIDHYWQTETGWPVAANCLGIERLPVVPGSPTRAVPGWDVHVLDEGGDEAAAGRDRRARREAADAARLLADALERRRALPRDLPRDVPGYYQTADAGYIDENGYVFVMARTDDIINIAGHRLSTGAMEEVLAAHPDVAECAVIGVADELKGQVPLGFLVLKAGVEPAARRDRRRGRAARARADRPGRLVQDRDRRRAAAEDALGEDPARRRCGGSRTARRTRPGDDRRSRRPRRGVRSASDDRVFEGAGLERLKTVGSSQLVSISSIVLARQKVVGSSTIIRLLN